MPKWLFVVCLLFTPTSVIAQDPVEGLKNNRETVVQELENVIAEAKKLNDKNAFVSIGARAAALIYLSDPARGETMFLDLWKMSQAKPEKDFDTRRSRLQILKYLYLRNPKLARRLIADRLAQAKSSEPARTVGFDDESPLAGELAASLLDTDPGAAAAILEQHLATVTTMEGVGALSQLRERNFLLADYIAAKTIESMTTRPTLASLPGLHLLGAYVFAGAEAPSPSVESDHSRQSLQYRYFVTGVEVLRASLNESREALLKNQHLTPSHLQFRDAYQAELAAIVSALAFRIRPSLAPELSSIAARLAPQVPARMPRLSQTVLARLSGNFSSGDPEHRFVFAISSGDFDTARSEVARINDSEKRSLYTQVLIKSEIRALLAKAELMEAITAIRKLENRTERLATYLDALKTIRNKRDVDVVRVIISEAGLLIPQTDRNGFHARAQLAFASQLAKLGAAGEAVEFLARSVATINALHARPNEGNDKSFSEETMAELDDPKSLLDEPYLEQAFAGVSKFDLDAALVHAKTIQPKSVQLLARIQTIQIIIKQDAVKPKSAVPARAFSRG